ncbi:MAG: type II pantothenate kinase [Clostridia bacterium]|nr:type II pantothenate kinase [Clostridia bacterium]MBR3715331.1 type II pantothenate kinase [Clostridia bacterium]
MANKYVLGIDIGGSTTKIVGFDENKNLVAPMFVHAEDQLTSIYGAFGKFTAENHIDLSQIKKIMLTGVGATYITSPLYNIECETLVEFPCVGRGGLYLSGLDEAIVVSMGTGTAVVHADKNGNFEYLGGTGVGGGTLIGLSKKMLGTDNVANIVELASQGDISKVDLRVSDISRKDIHPGLAPDLTASNFGKLSDLATPSDIALGLFNMIFESVAMIAAFAARRYGVKDIVLTGNMTTFPQAKQVFGNMNNLFEVNYIIPENSRFGTVIGAALSLL